MTEDSTSSALPRGVRNNNPGNLEFNPRVFERDPWVGELGLEEHPSARFTRFNNPQNGIRALCKTLLTYQRTHNLMTIEQMIHRWAPFAENNTPAYVRMVAIRMGWPATIELDLDAHPLILGNMAKAIIAHENSGYEYADSIMLKAIREALA